MTKQKTALVTGSGQGIGEAMVKRLSKDGFSVTVADLNEENANRVAKEINDNGGKALAVVTDVTDLKSVSKAIEDTIEEFGDFNVIVNNAGISINGPVQKVIDEDYEKVFNVNVKGVLWGIQAAAKAFEKLGHGGKIISASSQGGIKGTRGSSIYSASKFAVRGLTQSAAQELADLDITVNAHAPGTVKTPFLESAVKELAEANNTSEEEEESNLTGAITLGRASEPEDIAKVISFLAGPDSDYITGQTIVVDGGMVFH